MIENKEKKREGMRASQTNGGRQYKRKKEKERKNRESWNEKDEKKGREVKREMKIRDFFKKMWEVDSGVMRKDEEKLSVSFFGESTKERYRRTAAVD